MKVEVEFDNATIREAVNLWCQDERSKRVAARRYGDITAWNVSRVTDMSRLFANKKDFNDDISQWNVSNVRSMRRMFANASSFNQPLNSWDVSNLFNASHMFSVAISFNQPLHNWNLKSALFLDEMFNRASSFNQPLDPWDVSKVRNMRGMFRGASAFNQPLENWNLTCVRSTTMMFREASSFNQPLNQWDVSQMKTMSLMFCEAVSFNQPLDNWDISNVKDMLAMFRKAKSFNQSLHRWDFSGVENAKAMFQGATSYNQPLINRDEALHFAPTVSAVVDISSAVIVEDNQCQPAMSSSSTSRKRAADAVAAVDAGGIGTSPEIKRCHREELVSIQSSSTSVQEVQDLPPAQIESITVCRREDLPRLEAKLSLRRVLEDDDDDEGDDDDEAHDHRRGVDALDQPEAKSPDEQLWAGKIGQITDAKIDPTMSSPFSPSIKTAFEEYLWETLAESTIPADLIPNIVEILRFEGVSSFDIWLELTTDELKALVEDHHDVHHHGILDALLLMHREAISF
jgi:hypothetical protein